MDPEIILLPYRRDPATGSLIPSISTGGTQRNPTIKKTEATDRSGEHEDTKPTNKDMVTCR